MRYRMQYARYRVHFCGNGRLEFFYRKVALKGSGGHQASSRFRRSRSTCWMNVSQIQTQLSELSTQADIIKKLDSKVAVADVLAELSFLTDSRIIFTQVDIQAEEF